MRKAIFRTFCGALVLACVGLIVVWARSYRVADTFSRQAARAPVAAWVIESSRGRVTVSHRDFGARRRRGAGGRRRRDKTPRRGDIGIGPGRIAMRCGRIAISPGRIVISSGEIGISRGETTMRRGRTGARGRAAGARGDIRRADILVRGLLDRPAGRARNERKPGDERPRDAVHELDPNRI